MKPGPDKVVGPLLANLFQRLARMIAEETGAVGVRVLGEFKFNHGRGNLTLRTFTTPDAKTERLLDPEVPMPRGAKLAHDAYAGLRRLFGIIAASLERDAAKRQARFEHMARELLAASEKMSLRQKTVRWARLISLLPQTGRQPEG